MSFIRAKIMGRRLFLAGLLAVAPGLMAAFCACDEALAAEPEAHGCCAVAEVPAPDAPQKCGELAQERECCCTAYEASQPAKTDAAQPLPMGGAVPQISSPTVFRPAAVTCIAASNESSAPPSLHVLNCVFLC